MNRKKVFTGFIWRFLERCGAQGVGFIVTIVLARILAPELYGTIALVTVFTKILQTFVDSGMGNALIQKKNADDLDFSSVFYFNMAVCIILYIGMFIASPFIAKFYNNAELIPVIRFLSLTLIISGVKNVQQAYVSRNMLFKRFFFATLGGTLGAAVIGVAMALAGFGVWALVVQQIFNSAVDTLILWITVKWRPKKMFSIERLKTLFSFGWKLLVSTLLETSYTEVRQLIIGKMYTTSDLGYYNRGRQFPDLLVANINTSIDSVLLPAMSNEQESSDRVKDMTRRAIKISTYILAPLMMGLVFVAEPLVKLVLTDKWLPCVPFLRIFCISYMFISIHTANLNAIKAMGRSDLFLKLEIIKKIMGTVVLLSTMWFGVMIMAYSMLFTNVMSQIINSWPNRKLLNYRYVDQIKDIAPNILLATFMGLCVYCVNIVNLSDMLTLIIQVILGATVYVGSSIVLKLESFVYIWGLIKPILVRHKN